MLRIAIAEPLEARCLLAPLTLSDWSLSSDTGVSATDRITRDTTPSLNLHFSEPVFGTASDVAVLAPGSGEAVAAAVLGWGTDVLTINLAPLSVQGVFRVRLSGTIRNFNLELLNGGKGYELPFTTDTSAPVLVGQPKLNAASALSASASQIRTITLEFTEPVAVSLSNLQLRNRDTGQALDLSSRVVENVGNTMVLHLDRPGLDSSPQMFLADGNYELGLAGPLSDVAGNPIDYDGDGVANEEGVRFDFYKLLGDYNGDRRVTAMDMLLWKQKYGTFVPPTEPQYDLSGDGRVTAMDLLAWKKQYGAHIVANADGLRYVYDTTPPAIVIASPSDGEIVNNPELTVAYIVDGVSKMRNVTLAEGQNVISIAESDAAGNTAHASLTVTLDTIAPTIIVEKNGQPAPGITGLVQVSSSPSFSLDYRVEGVPYTANFTLATGSNRLPLMATDPAGNTSSLTLTVYYSPTTLTDPLSSSVITSPDGRSSVLVPSGASSSPAGVSVVTLSSADFKTVLPTGYELLGIAAFHSDRVAFDSGVTITLPLERTFVPGTSITLGILDADTGAIQAVSLRHNKLVVNEDGTSASAQVQQLSSYAALYSDDDMRLPRWFYIQDIAGVGTGSAVGSADMPLPDLFTGTFAHTVPIVVPAGRQNITPQLELMYRSSGGDTICGNGWNLPLPCIQRSTKGGVPSYNDSESLFLFSDKGQTSALVHLTGNLYESKIESSAFRRFYKEADDSWRVVTKDGLVLTFGATAESKVAGGLGTFAWYITKTIDPNGNYIAYTYVMDEGQVYPYRIEYTGNETIPTPPKYSIEFPLQNRPDISGSYITGAYVVSAKRLSQVLIRADNSLVRRYELTYSNSSATGRSLLTAIQPYGADGATPGVRTTFAYNPGNGSAGEEQMWANNLVGMNGEWNSIGYTLNGAQRTAMIDINGDGLPDRVSTPSSGTLIAQLNTGIAGSGFGPELVWASNISGVNEEWTSIAYTVDGAQRTALMDINGDGLPDRVSTFGSGTLTVQLNKGTSGDGFQPERVWASNLGIPPLGPATNGATDAQDAISYVLNGTQVTGMLDINGDGLPDRVLTGGGAWYVQVNTGKMGEGFSPRRLWATGFDGGDQSSAISYTANGAELSGMLDINGDGLPDRVMTGQGKWFVQLNTGRMGDGFGPRQLWASGLTGSEEANAISYTVNGAQLVGVADINGDGLPDRVITEQGQWYVQFNTGKIGEGFGSKLLWASNIVGTNDEWRSIAYTQGAAQRTAFMDINGDGLADRVKLLESGSLTVQLNTGAARLGLGNVCPPDTLIAINNGIGGTTEVSYRPAQQLGVGAVPYPVFVVTQIKVTDTQPSDSMPESYTQNMSYQGAYFDRYEREFCGFGAVTVSDPITGNYTQTRFYQGTNQSIRSRSLNGRISSIIAYDGTGSVISNETNAYTILGIGPGQSIHYAMLTQVDTTVYENGVSVSFRKRLSYDGVGNVISESSDGDVALSGDEHTVVTVYTGAYGVDRQFNTIRRIQLWDSSQSPIRETSYDYDILGNRTRETAWLYGGTSPITQYTYDDYGNRLTVTDPLKHQTATNYEGIYHQFPSTVANALGQVTHFAYDARFGVLQSQTDPNGNSIGYEYDSLGRLLTVTDPYSRVTARYSYPDFNTTIESDFFGHKTTQYIDGLNRTYRTVADGEDGITGKDVVSERTYDNTGHLSSESLPHYADADPASIAYMRYSYDIRGRLIRQLEDYPGTADDAVTQTQYLSPMVTKLIDASNHATTTIHDVFNRVVEIVNHTSSGDVHTRYQYDAANQLTRLTDARGDITSISFDSLGRKIEIHEPNTGSTSYTYGACLAPPRASRPPAA